MISILLLGFLIGLRHALEADHLAAVATLATRSHSAAETIRQGTVWGLGHTITLLFFGSIVLWLDTVMPQRLALGLEFAVGVMLILLGIDVVVRMLKQRVHFHAHAHGDTTHFHVHSHTGEKQHNPLQHKHEHRSAFPLRALFIGLMHGMAGSAALILLTLETVRTPALGIIYILLFGLGSIVGMAVLSFIIAMPLRAPAKGLTWLHNGLQGAIGAISIILGATLLYHTGINTILFT